VAHDFNNILTGIDGYAQIVLSELDPDSSAGRDVAQIRALAERAAGLTRQLLAFSRRQTLEPVVVNLNDLVANLAKMLQRLLGETIELDLRPAPDQSPVRADPGQIEQVLMNLAINARDAMPGGGRLTIETRNVEVDEQAARRQVDAEPGPYVLIRVSDTGAGMDAETLSHAFEPFFTTKEVGRGTGLGLSMAYGIVREHGGWIRLESHPGEGTTFRIYLPRVEAPSTPAAAPAPPRREARGTETILLVEDDPAVRTLGQRVLRRQGYRVLTACTPDEALRLAARAGPGPEALRLVVTDVVLPGLKGPDLYARLAARRPGLRVIYMSGYTDEVTVPPEVRGRKSLFLQKPFPPRVLLEKVREVLDR